MSYDKRHGGPYDRGAADSWYSRPKVPHYYVGNTYMSDKVTEDQMTDAAIKAYNAGYDINESDPFARKEWD